MLQSALLSTLPNIQHAFGTRHSALTQDAMASLQQIHSAIVHAVDRPGPSGEGDALITAQPGVPVSIRTADCLPILLADPRTGAVAAIHAGWRGTAAKIAEHAVTRMRAQFNARPEDLFAAIGPGIGECCYEVGPEVARHFGLNSAAHLNLATHNRRQLESAGVLPKHIDLVSPCTYCDTRFFSYRRQGQAAGRMISYIVGQPFLAATPL